MNSNLFFKSVVLFVDLCVLRDLSHSIKYGHKAHNPACRQARNAQRAQRCCNEQSININFQSNLQIRLTIPGPS